MARIVDKALIAKKVGMTRMIDSEGKMIPVTLLQIQKQQVTKVLTPERDGYHGFQIGFYEKSEKKLNKPDLGRLRKGGIEGNYTRFSEFRTEGPVEGFEAGVELKADIFDGIGSVDILGRNKGRGFQGAVKRHGSAIGRMTHGSRFHRRPGSLGQCTTPGRVYKNKKMPGHMGDRNVTIANLKVVKIDEQLNVIALKGSVPGHREGYVEIRPTYKVK